MPKDEEYTKKLERIIKQMLQPLHDIPFNIVIEAICGCKIIPFDKNDPKDVVILTKLTKVANYAGKEVNREGIRRPRPNEVGNDIEPFVKNALKTFGYFAETPSTKKGVRKTTGYPDIEFVDEFNRVNYLECKTYNIQNVDTTQRSFYLSPSGDFKITKDGHHFVISFEIFESGRQGNTNIYKCNGWKVLSIEKLEVDVKYEFNSDNARLYAKGLILAERRLDT
jgi:hypothetical protein